MEEKKKSKLKIIFIIIAIVVIAIVILILIIQKGSSKSLQIGETAKSKRLELTLNDVQYGNMICDITSKGNVIYDGYLLPTDNKNEVYHPNTYIRNDDYTFVSLSFDFKYLGNKSTSAFFLFNKIYIQYDNKYKFDLSANNSNFKYIYAIINNEWKEITHSSLEIQPLSSEYTCRTVLCVPKNIMEDNKPLTVNFKRLGRYYYYL